MRKTFTVLFILLPLMLTAQKEYKIKKVPSAPLNLHGLAKDIHAELLTIEGGEIIIGGRPAFVLDEYDSDIFEFIASKEIGRSGSRSCQFFIKDGDMYFPRKADYETSKHAQGVLYNDMKDKWDRYLRDKERQE